MSSSSGDDDLARARMLVELDRDEEARVVLARVLAENGDDPEALCLLAQAHLGVGEPAEALPAARAAAELEPEQEWPLRLAAIAASRCRRHAEAVRYADAAIRLDPGNWRTHEARAEIDLYANAVTEASEAAAHTARRLAPHESSVHRTCGNVALVRGRRRDATAALQEALRIDPSDAGARNDLARVDVGRQRLGRAARGFADAAALDPQSDVAVRNLTTVGTAALRVLHLILGVSVFAAGRGADGQHHPWVVAAAGFATFATVVFGAVLWRGARPEAGRLARVVLRRDGMLQMWSGCLAVVYLAVVAAAFVSPGSVRPFVNVGLVALLVGVLVMTLRDRWRW